jgi:DNA-binding CsgD family transcriptional regulator
LVFINLFFAPRSLVLLDRFPINAIESSEPEPRASMILGDGGTSERRMPGRTLEDTFARAIVQRYHLTPVNLTPRELDILMWMAEGKSDWEIGVILKVSKHFVDKIARQLRTKMNATNRTQTVATAFRYNLIR